MNCLIACIKILCAVRYCISLCVISVSYMAIVGLAMQEWNGPVDAEVRMNFVNPGKDSDKFSFFELDRFHCRENCQTIT